LLEEELDSVPSFDVIDENDRFPSDEFELEKDVDVKELVTFRRVRKVLREEACRRGFRESQDGLYISTERVDRGYELDLPDS
jgi:hypothetical protein